MNFVGGTGFTLERIAGFLEVLIGISMIIFVWQLLGHDDPGHMEDIGLYAIHVFEIIAGLIGIVKSKKGSLLTVLLGVILFLMNLVEFFMHTTNIIEIIIHALTLIVPYYYVHNAVKLFRNKVE
ncbi:MAG: hypothetical protein MR807_09045 [Erysipelotrichaceae bacterium]|nr:hypothetical protein [Erysipelotrichaceae bacterium]